MFLFLFIAVCSLPVTSALEYHYTDCSSPILVEEIDGETLNITVDAYTSCQIEFIVTTTSRTHWIAFSYSSHKGDSLFITDSSGYNNSIPSGDGFTSNLWFYVTTTLSLHTSDEAGANLLIEYHTQALSVYNSTALSLKSGSYVIATPDPSAEFTPITVECSQPFSMFFVEGFSYSANIFVTQGPFGSSAYIGRLSTLQASGKLAVTSTPYVITIFRYTTFEGNYILLGRTEADIEGFASYQFYAPFTFHSAVRPQAIVASVGKPSALTIAGQFGYWLSDVEFISNSTTMSIYPAVESDPFPPLTVYSSMNNTVRRLPQYLSAFLNTIVVEGGAASIVLTQHRAGIPTNFTGTGTAAYCSPFYMDSNFHNEDTPVSLSYRKYANDSYDMVLSVADCDPNGSFVIGLTSEVDGKSNRTMKKGDFEIVPNVTEFNFRYLNGTGSGGLLQYSIVPAGSVYYTTTAPPNSTSHNRIPLVALFFALLVS